MTKNCQHCGIIFTFPPSHSYRKYCSVSCAHKYVALNMSGDKSPKWRRIEKNCIHCKTRFTAKGDRVDKGQGKFCSLKCWGLWSWSNMPQRRTDIEIAMTAILKLIGIEYEKEKNLNDIAIVDFFIPSKNLAIQCDGEYWHTLKKKIEKDNWQDFELKKAGFKVIRFWGNQIKKYPDVCREKILQRVA
jgi:very-short-patch-repair endonuclease